MLQLKRIKFRLESIYLILLSLLNENFINFQIVNGHHNENHSITKRMDLESCLGQFDIHRNMIIRTEESLAIGGKYLQGIALETVEECRRLCCETEFCDVFVFEEKSEEYCYLFECGRPENFRCKFTKHGNFTSAVLTPIRYLAPLATTTKSPPQTPPPPPPPPPQIVHTQLIPPVQSKQEMELKNLKKNLDTQPKRTQTTQIPAVQSVITSTTTKTSTNILPTTCGRFQFQCHSGECIGIYNACNGIPQCQDGSDEGPECSDPANTNGGLQNQNLAGSYNRFSMINPNKNDDRTIHKAPEPPTILKPLEAGRVYQQQQQQQQQQQIVQGPPRAAILNRDNSITNSNMMWPNRKIQLDQQLDMKPNSEIFRHKPGLQIPSNNIIPFSNQNSPVIYNGLSNQRGIYVVPELQNVYGNGIIQPQDQLMLPNMNWPQSQDQIQSMMPENLYNSGNINTAQQQISQKQQLQSPSAVKITQETVDSSGPVQITPSNVTTPDISGTIKSKLSNNTRKSVKQNDEDLRKNIPKEINKDSEEYVDYSEAATEAPKKKHKHKKVQKEVETKTNKKVEKEHPKINAIAEVKIPYHEGYKMEMEFVDHDGYSERPGGAVLSLTLGVLVTAALAILIGCRMRTVGRRVRRLGKAPFGNDADFLVNGMYL